MRTRVTSFGWEVWAPAKLNLFLEVLAKRADGFHEIETLMVPINLYDTLYFSVDPNNRKESGERIELHCGWASPAALPAACAGAPLPEGERNSVVRALELLRQRCGIRRGATVRLIKRIPVAAGLAGGSSDAAAALVAGNLGWKLGLSAEALADLAGEVGSDVPFFLQHAAAICRGRGERIEPCARLTGLHFVVVYPPAGLGTADVYRGCRPAEVPRPAHALVEALWQRRSSAGRLLHNGLEPAAARLSPWIPRLEQEFARQDVLGARMSGSGTSYFGLCRSAGHARRVAGRLRTRGLGHVYAARSCSG